MNRIRESPGQSHKDSALESLQRMEHAYELCDEPKRGLLARILRRLYYWHLRLDPDVYLDHHQMVLRGVSHTLQCGSCLSALDKYRSPPGNPPRLCYLCPRCDYVVKVLKDIDTDRAKPLETMEVL